MAILICLIILVILILLSLYVYKESKGYHIVKYFFSDRRVKKDKVSIVFLSDLHNMQYGKKNIDLLNDIVKLNPDYVMLGGDMITSCMEKFKDFSDTLDFIKELSARYPVFYGMGNHEERLDRSSDKFPEGTYKKLSETLAKINAPIMIDEKKHIEEANIDVFGLNLDHLYYRKFITRKLPGDYLEGKLGKVNPDVFSILIAHNPEHFKSYAKWGADLVLSGHVHGGIVRLPVLGGVISPAMKLFPKYDGGLFSEEKSKMVLSRGIGTHTVPIRVNNKAELIYIEINKE